VPGITRIPAQGQNDRELLPSFFWTGFERSRSHESHRSSVPFAIHADGFIVVHDPPETRPGHYRFAPLEVKYHRVQVDIKGPVATTEIDQEFYNPNPRDLEGDYLFPVPKGAQIDDFRMSINGKMTSAELLDANKARKIYEDIVRKMRDPALLEYADQDLFRVRIYPIEARKTKRIILKYTEILKTDFGLSRYIYPLNTEKFSASPIDDVSVEVRIAGDKSVKTIFSPSHEIEIVRPSEKSVTVAYEEHKTRPDKDFALFFSYADTREIGLDLLTYREEGEDGFFAILASPGAAEKEETAIPKDIVLVIDTSGSMAGEKLAQAQRALKFCVANLNEADRFDIVRFSTEAEPLFGRLEEATTARRGDAEEFVNTFRPRGGTAIEDALVSALEILGKSGSSERPFIVIFLTDGLPTIGTRDREELVKIVTRKTEDTQARIFCFGIGTEINTHLLDEITEKTRAASEYVLPEEDIEVKVSNFYTKIDSPVLTDLGLSFSDDVRAREYHPNPLPDLFRGDQLVVLGRYSGSGAASITVTGRMAGEHRSYSFPGEFPKETRQNAFLPRMWATRRVGYLLDQIRLNGESDELREEITRLARRYGVVTPYTAYLIVEDETSRNVPEPHRVFSMPQDADGARRADALEVLGDRYRSLSTRESGAEAVAGARITSELKRAPAGSGGGDASWSAMAPSLSTEERSKVEAFFGGRGSQTNQPAETKYVDGRLFYRKGQTWLDSLAIDSGQEPQRIKFLSDEYFQLMDKHPEAKAWLALGASVMVEIDGKVYEIHE
jgi:Ca-activated chloride channel family protein